jgi:ApbE superfamily uncharacterized protein (UPF0280 family)
MSRQRANRLRDGRLHLNDGPIDLIIACDGFGDAVARAEAAAITRFATILDELCTELPLLRAPVGARPEGKVARRMWRAASLFAADDFLTPMAAVAGSVAEEILAAMTEAAPLTRALVNNGGDIAIHLTPGANCCVGLIDRPERPSMFASATIALSDNVRGVATSGWRGRSFSLGIADAVTVLAERASVADAAATLIANAVDLPGSRKILRRPAVELQPDSDLGERLVTVEVGPLSDREIRAALVRGAARARRFRDRGLICGCALHLAGATITLDDIRPRHCERSEATQKPHQPLGLLRFARNDGAGSTRIPRALAPGRLAHA